MLKLFNNKGFKWKNKSEIWFKGYLFDGNKLKTEEKIFAELQSIHTKENMKTWLSKAKGCFSVIIKKDEIVLLAVDNIRTFPIFYSVEKDRFIITDNPVYFFQNTKEIDTFSALELESAAYITGKRTIYKNVYQVRAGELITYSNNKIDSLPYTNFFIHKIDNSNYEQLQEKLVNKLNIIFKRLIESLDGRQAVVPLSSGYDSRLIVCMLKKFGYNNVYTFTYGRKENFELKHSKQVAQTLGFSWKFIEYNNLIINNFIDDNVFKEYYHFAGKASSMFYMQDYFAVKYLYDNKLIDNDAIFISGHSGDAVAGSHLRAAMAKQISDKQIINYIYKKTYTQNNHKQNKNKFLQVIRDYIKNQPANIPAYNIFENWLFTERQAKFVVNSANVFDFFGYEYRLPFWDADIVDFFKLVPFKYKLYKNLYDETLIKFYFNTFKVSFDNETQVSPFDIKKQSIKNRIRPYLPNKIKLYYLEKNDWMAYSIITKILLNDLKKKNIQYKFKADIYNSIISKWYVECIRKNKTIENNEIY